MGPRAADPTPAVDLARRELLDSARWRRSPQRSRTTKPTVRERGRARHWRVHESRYTGRPGTLGSPTVRDRVSRTIVTGHTRSAAVLRLAVATASRAMDLHCTPGVRERVASALVNSAWRYAS